MPTITYTQEGGFAGLALHRTAAAEVEDLPAPAREALDRLAATARSEGGRLERASHMPDVSTHRIAWEHGGAPVEVVFDDAAVPPEAFALLDALSEMSKPEPRPGPDDPPA